MHEQRHHFRDHADALQFIRECDLAVNDTLIVRHVGHSACRWSVEHLRAVPIDMMPRDTVEPEPVAVQADADPAVPALSVEAWCEFVDAWEKEAKKGMADDMGGAEFRRVLKEWAAAGFPGKVPAFIRNRANFIPPAQ